MKSKKKLIVIIAAVIIVIGGMIGAYIAFSGGDILSGGGNDIEVKLINEDTGEYMATGVSKNYVFSIETGGGADSVQVYDIEGSQTDAFCEQTDGGFDIRAPKQGYEKGGIYKIDLAEGCSFRDEKLKKAKSLLFVVNKNNTADVDYTDEVKTPDSGSIEKTGNSLLLDGEYSSGDIVATDTDNDGVDELYKLENAETVGEHTFAEYVDPDADEVYENIDIFMHDYIDFEETDIDTDAFEGALEEAGILDAFIDPVYAAGNAGIKITSKKGDDNEYLFTAVITDPKNKKRQLTIKFGVKDRFLILSNGEQVMVDNTVEITSGLEFSVSGESSAETEQKILDAIEEYTLNNEEIGDENNYEVPLVPIRIPVAGPVVADIDIGLTADILFSAKFSAGMDTKVSLTQGVAVNIKQRKIVEKYAEVTGSTEAYICVEGKLDAFAGVYADLGLEIPVLVKLGVNIKGGPYLEGQGCFSVKGIPKDIKAEGKCDIEIGLRFKAEGDLKILNLKKKPIKLADKKKVLVEYSNKPNPWEYFNSINPIGKTKSQIENMHGPLEYEMSYSGALIYKALGSDVSYWFSISDRKPGEAVDAADSAICLGIGGFAGNLFGIENNISLDSFAKEIDSSNEFELHEDDGEGACIWMCDKVFEDVSYKIQTADSEIVKDTWIVVNVPYSVFY